MSNKNFTRYIKEENFRGQEIATIPSNTNILDPIFLRTSNKKDNPICLTKLGLDKNNNLQFYNNYKCSSNVNDYKKYLYIPPIGLSSAELLKIYNIHTVDDITTTFDEMLESGENYHTINRILNCWIKNNFDFLKGNNFLDKIYNKLLSIYLDSKIIKKINLEKEINSYIKTWLSKKTSNDFDFDLLNDMMNHLNK